MTLIKSISGIRGTIGGFAGQGLTPVDIVKFTSAYAAWIKKESGKVSVKIIVGRDARVSGDMVNRLVVGTLLGSGADVVDLGLSTTPTVEIAVTHAQADGGIIITASHNPKQWNALKLLNEKGEFISADEGKEILELAEKDAYEYAKVDFLGDYSVNNDYIDIHIEQILNLPMVDVEAIKKAGFRVVVDCVNSTGGLALPKLLKALGVLRVDELYCEPTGVFPHNPEPLPEHLEEIAEKVEKSDADLGFVVDPDVDRLAIVCENGEMFGEEYTLVAVADYVLQHQKGNTVSNLSSTKALKDVTEKYGGQHFASAVGEVNVVAMMKEQNAVIGGEGNGGVIYPDLHYGRDALVGIALFLSHLAKFGKTCSLLKKQYPEYHISKNKIELSLELNTEEIINKVQSLYAKHELNTTDGLKIMLGNEWVHLRRSNTEPIIRIYAESDSMTKAEALASKLINDIKAIIKEM